MADITIIGADGVGRRARKGEILQEGERIHFPATLMDAMQAAMADATAPDHTIRDGYGSVAGHRPGYAFAPPDVRLRQDAMQAYEERCKFLGDAWRHRDQPEPLPQQLLRQRADAAELATADAAQAWDAKVKRLQNAWRQRG